MKKTTKDLVKIAFDAAGATTKEEDGYLIVNYNVIGDKGNLFTFGARLNIDTENPEAFLSNWSTDGFAMDFNMYDVMEQAEDEEEWYGLGNTFEAFMLKFQEEYGKLIDEYCIPVKYGIDWDTLTIDTKRQITYFTSKECEKIEAMDSSSIGEYINEFEKEFDKMSRMTKAQIEATFVIKSVKTVEDVIDRFVEMGLNEETIKMGIKYMLVLNIALQMKGVLK